MPIQPIDLQTLFAHINQVGKDQAVLKEGLTTQQAADILNVSRPYLIKLLDQGFMDHHKVGRHRRVRACDVFEYKQEMEAERSDALSELARTDADFI